MSRVELAPRSFALHGRQYKFSSTRRNLHAGSISSSLAQCEGAQQASEGATEVSVPSQKVQKANSILSQVLVKRLNAHLAEEAKHRVSMPLAEVVALIKEHRITDNDVAAIALVHSLHTCGIVMLHGSRVFLNAEEVADIILRALPDTEAEAVARCNQIDGDLEPLRQLYKEIDRRALSRSRGVAYLGLAGLIAQVAIFIRLTYWELSWDVMEPVSYFTGQIGMIVAYVYFLATWRDFGYEQHFSGMKETELARLMRQVGFDRKRYMDLLQEQQRWQRFARSMAR